MEPVFQARIV